MIQTLLDAAEFRRRCSDAWTLNGAYWLSAPLRHVTDAGSLITSQIAHLCGEAARPIPIVVDMGCGSCWLLDTLTDTRRPFRYVGLDNNQSFLDNAQARYAGRNAASFRALEVDVYPSLFRARADIVVNAFNFFELADLDAAMRNVAAWLVPGGRLFMSTIDKTYLILAMSDDWPDFIENLKQYGRATGVAFGFQKIDLGNKLSNELEYPSVLYSTQDFIDSAKKAGLCLESYIEQNFAARPIPKIYCHLQFRKQS